MPPDTAPEAPAKTVPSDEEITYAWRFERLRRLGFPYEEAELLASVSDVVDRASKLLGRGCSPETAARIIL